MRQREFILELWVTMRIIVMQKKTAVAHHNQVQADRRVQTVQSKGHFRGVQPGTQRRGATMSRFGRERLESAERLLKLALTAADPEVENIYDWMGYHQLIINVTDRDTGKAVGRRRTYRKPEDFPKLLDDINELAIPPDEILEQVGFQLHTVAGQLIKKTTAKKILSKQIIGGRPKQGRMSPEKEKHYAGIADAFRKSGLSQREYCEATGIKISTLKRATNYKKVSRKGKT